MVLYPFFFQNQSLSTESYDYPLKDTQELIGGDDSNNDIPNGGFPPIYLCKLIKNNDPFKSDNKKQKREYETHKTAVSIKSILEKRRDITPFISS